VDLHLSSKIVLITGGSKGLGGAIAHRFASEGCHLHLVARTQATLDETAHALRQQFPVTVKTIAIDLAQRGSAQHVAETCGDVDILVNNAGDVPSGSLETVDEERWRAGWDTKVFAYINLSREYFRRMKARRSGVIINVTGIGGDLLDPGYIAGGVGNAAMAAFTKSLGANSHTAGVRVVGINPGPCATERFERLARAKAQEKYGDRNASVWPSGHAGRDRGRHRLPRLAAVGLHDRHDPHHRWRHYRRQRNSALARVSINTSGPDVGLRRITASQASLNRSKMPLSRKFRSANQRCCKLSRSYDWLLKKSFISSNNRGTLGSCSNGT